MRVVLSTKFFYLQNLHILYEKKRRKKRRNSIVESERGKYESEN
jgi:hypothetical protein